MPTSSSAYRGKSIVNTHLKWDVFVTPSIPVVTTDFALGEQERPWPPISSTLIYGSRDAVVVDSFITLEQARAQAEWTGSTGKNLTTIYATHGQLNTSLQTPAARKKPRLSGRRSQHIASWPPLGSAIEPAFSSEQSFCEWRGRRDSNSRPLP